MRALVVLAAAVPLGLSAAVVDAEPTSALVTYESTTTDVHGVTHTIRYQERIVRDDNNVWIVRVLPKPEPRIKRARDLDLEMAARWFTRDGNEVKLTLVSMTNQLIVDVPAESFESLGAPRRWQDLPDPRRPKAGKAKLERNGTLPWTAVTAQFQHVDLTDLGD